MSDDARHARDTAAIATWRRWRMGELRAEREDVATEAESDATQARRQEAQRQQEALDALREQVRRDAYEEGLRQGREAGHAEGLAQGREEAQQEADAAFERRLEEEITPLRELTRQFDEALATLDDTIADDLVELALATGRQLAGEALKTRPRQVLELVRALLHTDPPLVGQQRLWLHPLDLRLVEKTLGDELAAAGWRLQPDDRLGRGGCRVTGENGELDATWESRWQAVRDQQRQRRTRQAGNGEPRSE
ncbi:flagellar assembly protein FliH [Halomonas elongata]|uniref:flagellar assembly protein FliH n=1 Tax=Halomonas elongata TaxID=2746 RepID=UPI000DCF0C18|nr:flagellar assembly protein FliH [Halomonas elongata]RAW07108.1 flagellar assembly protein FliH [Halomonas elongata]